MSEHDETLQSASSPPAGRFVAWQAAAWCAAAPLLAAVAARAAVWVEHYRAPVVIFPLLVGCSLGLVLVLAMRLANIGHRPTLLAGTVLAAAAAIAGQHYFAYREHLDARAAFLAHKQDDASLAALVDLPAETTPSFADYMRGQAATGRPLTVEYKLRGAAAWASWAFDGILLLAAAVTMVYFFSRAPYCNACRSWYRSVRSGAIRGEMAHKVVCAAAMQTNANDQISAARYRFSHCSSGCGPTRLELTWNDVDGPERHGEAWLSAAAREEVVKALDESVT